MAFGQAMRGRGPLNCLFLWLSIAHMYIYIIYTFFYSLHHFFIFSSCLFWTIHTHTHLLYENCLIPSLFIVYFSLCYFLSCPIIYIKLQNIFVENPIKLFCFYNKNKNFLVFMKLINIFFIYIGKKRYMEGRI